MSYIIVKVKYNNNSTEFVNSVTINSGSESYLKKLVHHISVVYIFYSFVIIDPIPGFLKKFLEGRYEA